MILLNTFSAVDFATIIATAISVLGGLLYAGYKFGILISSINGIETDLKSVKHDVKYIPQLIDRVNLLWRSKVSVSKSPMVLNDYGNQLLTSSRIDKLTDKYYQEIIAKVKEKNPENAYQAQEAIIDVIADYKNYDKCKDDLEKAAFESGSDIDTILLVAAINIRDSILSDLNFNQADIDKYDPIKNKPNKVD